MNKNLLLIILAHNNKESLQDFVLNINFFCPNIDIAVYNSGSDKNLTSGLSVLNIIPNRQLDYAKITMFFFDTFTWLQSQNFPYENITILDSDILFIKRGFPQYIANEMKSFDYLAQDLRYNIHTRPKWRPIRSLRPELNEWYSVLGFNHMNGAFNPGQTFNKNYIIKLLKHEKFNSILNLVNSNKSYTLHEVLFPTLIDCLDIRAKSFPSETNTANRYRPYQAISGVKTALSIKDAYFVHPVKREMDNPTRVYIRETLNNQMGKGKRENLNHNKI
jgi:hypothetical protein